MRRTWIGLAVALAACSAPAPEVFVDVRTDLEPGRELVAVRTELGDRSDEYVVPADADLLRGVRVGHLERVPRGDSILRVSLLASGARVVLSREVRVHVEDRLAVTVVLTRSCQGVTCPGPSDPAALTACLGGACVDPACTGEHPELCGTPRCTVDRDCTPPSECARVACREGTCFASADDTLCEAGSICDPDEGCVAPELDGGLPDAGPPDTGPPDAGPPDAGPPDAGPDDTACDDVHADALFCDGFESGDLSGWLSSTMAGGLATVTPSPAYRGTGAMRAQWTRDGSEVYVEASIPAVTSGALHVRGFVYVPASTSLDVLNVLAIGENVSPTAGVAVQIRGDTLGVYASTDDVTTVAPTYVFPRDRWVCLELELVVSDSMGSIRLRADGAIALERSGADTRPGGGHTRLTTGAAQYTPRATPAGVAHYDEVVVDRTAIGCD